MLMRYSDTLHMRPATIGAQADVLDLPGHWVPRPFPQAPQWARMGQRFDSAHLLACHPPVDLGRIEGAGVGADDGERGILRTPVKVPGECQVHLPTELAPIRAVVLHALETFAAHHPQWVQAHAHVTWEAGWVDAGATQRVPGWHVDGFQGVRQAPHASEASVFWADALPTEYCLQPFFVTHLDSARHNVQLAFEDQAHETNAYAGLAHHLYLIDPYLVHRSAVARRRTWRNFVRVTVADVGLEDPGNTVNLALAARVGAPPPRLEVRDRLYRPSPDLPWGQWGLHPLRLPSAGAGAA
jgi:hypothetical protein